MSRRALFIETALIYGLAPLLIIGGILPKSAVMPLLWIVFLYAFLLLWHTNREMLQFHLERNALFRVLGRFALLAPFSALFVWLFYPGMLFAFVREQPGLWLVIMLLYPLLSVFAQEVVFRAFFVYRFRGILKNEQLLIFSNALLFAYVHTVFGNALAVTFSFLGALLFMQTYLRSRSLLLCTLEHALYGNLLFTLGLGGFFYHGS